MPALQDMARLRGFRGVLFVPLLRDRTTIGLISVTRKEPGAFAAHHIQLLQTFADQAVIAIENVRLFDEVQAKTGDLQESLLQQTATAEILGVISRSPGDLAPVFDADAGQGDASVRRKFWRSQHLRRHDVQNGRHHWCPGRLRRIPANPHPGLRTWNGSCAPFER